MDAPSPRLTPRERDVLAGLCDGGSRSEVADALFISLNTVKRHADSILAKYGLPRMTAVCAEVAKERTS